ncbi:MAG: DNA polymerase III subunit alpha [Bacilli bacterium]|nr:DNA polymerase III subunit alpha [Bacilli bacterium]
MNYIPLRVKTTYSLLTSLIDIEKLIIKCKELNINSIAICDDNMYGVMEFYKIAIKNDIKPIIGLEIKIEDKSILLYAKNYLGYQNLCYISSNDKTYSVLKENNNDLIVIVPYESIDVYDKLSKIFDDIYISYKSLEEREKIKNKRCVFANVVRCLNKEDREYLKYLYMIKDGKKITNVNDYIFDDNNYLLDIDELRENINKIDLINYKVINDMCNVNIETKEDLLPKYSLDKSFDEFKYLTELCKKGLLKRFNNKVPVRYADRLMYELEIINKMGFCNYFLVVWDFIKYSKQNKILVGPGRGSAAGSLACYSLGITDIDPLKYNLIFERFLNPQRITMPDIDTDFDSSKREDVIKYVMHKYGSKNVAQIITFATLKAKQVLRDVARIFDLNLSKTDEFIKLIDSNLSLSENKKNPIVLKELSKDTLLSSIYDIAIHLEGLKRQTSIHAAGVIISRKELDRYIPIIKVKNDEYITGYTMNYLEELGLLKMDFLAIDNLTLISKLLDEIKFVDFSKIPLDDRKTIELFRRVDTDGIFQFESSGMKNVLRKFNVSSFDDLVAIIALFRPGPMDNIDSYVKRKEGKEKVTYIHESLKPILKSTYGIIVYQEQIMQIASVMAGYTLGEADILRRAMGKKSHTIMENEKEKFITRSINNGYDKNVSTEVFDLIYKFADFGFNKSHSVGYSVVAFKMAYLKAHYPNYFMCHLLTMVIGNDVKTKQYINECKNNNINILLPCINRSSTNYVVENKDIRFPLEGIHNVGHLASMEILKTRKNGEFKSFFDFIKRCYGKSINKKTIEYLIYAGCFDLFGYNHKTLINNIDIGINYAELVKDLDESLVNSPVMEIVDEYNNTDLINQEYQTFGFYLSYHPVQNYRRNNFNTTYIKDNFNKIINIYLLIDNIRVIKTKKNEKMAFVLGSDEYGEIDMVMFPKAYEKYYNLSRGEVVLVTAKVEKRVNKYQLIINKIQRNL